MKTKLLTIALASLLLIVAAGVSVLVWQQYSQSQSCYDDGYRAGRAGLPVGSNPYQYHPLSNASERWMDGWNDGSIARVNAKESFPSHNQPGFDSK